MRAVLCKRHGLPERLVVEEVPSLTPGAGEVVVQVRAAGVNFHDTLIIQNLYQHEPGESRRNTAELLEWLAQGRLKPQIAARYRLDEAPRALDDLMHRRIGGKAVLII